MTMAASSAGPVASYSDDKTPKAPFGSHADLEPKNADSEIKEKSTSETARTD